MKDIISLSKANHECNDFGTTYETRDGKRHNFLDEKLSESWYNENYQNVLMASVSCSICGEAMIDNAWKLDL